MYEKEAFIIIRIVRSPETVGNTTDLALALKYNIGRF